MRIHLFYAIFMALTTTFCLNLENIKAQTAPPEPACSLKGIVTSDGEPLPFVTVTIKNTTLGSASDLSGQYEFGYIPEGEFVVKAQAIGFKPIEKLVRFDATRRSPLRHAPLPATASHSSWRDGALSMPIKGRPELIRATETDQPLRPRR